MTTKLIAVVSCLLVLIGLIFCFESLQTGNHSSRLSYSDLTVPSQDQTEAPLPDSVHTCEPPAPNHPLQIHQEPIQIPDEQWGIIGDFEARLSEDIASSDLLRSVLIPVTDDTPSNNELQRYLPPHAVIDGNEIEITAVETEMGYESAMLVSSLCFQYCDITFRIDSLEGAGLFPAIWMMPQSGAKYPEIDIYESLGSEPDRLYGVLHYEDEEGHARDYFDLESPGESHAVRFVWTEEELCWYLDGQQIFSTRACVPQEPMYLILNLAVGGNWPGAPTADTLFPTVFRVVVEELHVNQAAIRQRIESGI